MRSAMILGAVLASMPASYADVLVIDQLRILAESDVGKDVTNKIRDLVQKRSSEFRPAVEALEAEKESIDAQIKALKPGQDKLREELGQRVASFQSRSADFESRRQRVQRELDATRQDSYEKLFKAMQPILKNISSGKEAKLVLEKNAALYIDDSIDVTDQVIEILNKDLKSMNVEWVSLAPPQNPAGPVAGPPPSSAPSLGTK